jgi:hypothetical protein
MRLPVLMQVRITAVDMQVRKLILMNTIQVPRRTLATAR